MAVSDKLKAFLSASKAPYTVTKHQVAYTAQELAAASHVPGRQMAKCVLVTTDRGPMLVVLPAIYRVDFKRLRAVAGVKTATIATESDIKSRFPDVEVGAMSPFGNLYEVPVVVERTLADAEEIVFNAGSHTETIKMRYRDFDRLVPHKAGAFGEPFPGAAPGKGKAKSKSAKTKKTKKTATARRAPATKRRPRRRR
jgi:Ala-tRNA(Pro) deacylase